MTALWGISQYFHSFIISTLLSGDRSPSELGHFIHGGGTPVPIWAVRSIWKLWKPENLLSCRELNCDYTVVQPAVQSPCSDCPCPCSQMYGYGRYHKLEHLRISSIYSESEHSVQMGLDWMPDRYAWNTNCLHKEGSWRTRILSQVQRENSGSTILVSQSSRNSLKPIGKAEPLVNTYLTSKRLRTQLQLHVRLTKLHYKVKVFNSALRSNRSLSLVPHDVAAGPSGRAV